MVEKHRVTVLKSEATTVFPTPLSSAVLLAWPAPDKKVFRSKARATGRGAGRGYRPAIWRNIWRGADHAGLVAVPCGAKQTNSLA